MPDVRPVTADSFLENTKSNRPKAASIPCRHCGTQFRPHDPGDEFCCHGCAFVFQMIHNRGLDRFYQLRGTQALIPQRDRPFQSIDTQWLEEAIVDAAAKSTRETNTSPQRKLTCGVEGVSCLGCVWLIESAFRDCEGATRVTVSQDQATATFEWDAERLNFLEFAQDLAQIGYRLTPAGDIQEGSESRGLAFRLGLCGAFALNTMAFSLPRYLGMEQDFEFAALIDLVALGSSTLSLLVGGSHFFSRAWSAARRGQLHMDAPISLGILFAFLGSLVGWLSKNESLLYFDFVSTFVFLMLGGRWLQTVALEKARRKFQREAPIAKTAQIESKGPVILGKIEIGDVLLLSPGQVLPVGAQLLDSPADFSLAWTSGESRPLIFAPGQRIASGAENLTSRTLRLRVSEVWNGSIAQALTAPPESLDESDHSNWGRILPIYLSVIVFLALIGGAAWLSAGAPWSDALQVVISVFVVSCPCALGVALPFLDRKMSATAQVIGVFVRRKRFWYRLRNVRQLVFDKTGTLTLDRPILRDNNILDTLDPRVIAILHRLVSDSLHPLSRSLFATIIQKNAQLESLESYPITEVPGCGVTLKMDGQTWSLGKPGWLSATNEAALPTEHLSCDLRCDGKLIAHFAFEESLRPEAKVALPQATDLIGSHCKTFVLSGDAPERVQHFATQLGIPKAHAIGGLSPEGKKAALENLGAHHALFIGDGLNDALVSESAMVCGAPFADRAALDSRADFLFTAESLGFLPKLLRLGKQRTTHIQRAFGFAIIYNIAAITISLAGLMNPLIAAVIMPISSIISLLIVK